MPSYEERRILPYSPEQMFAVVADVDRYPEFVPGCAGLRVRARERDGRVEHLLADMIVACGGLREQYTSRVCCDLKAGTVTATQDEGAFKTLDTVWHFAQRPEGCELHFSITFEFRNKLLSAMANVAFDKMSRRMIDAFTNRVEALYGPKSKRAAQ